MEEPRNLCVPCNESVRVGYSCKQDHCHWLVQEHLIILRLKPKIKFLCPDLCQIVSILSGHGTVACRTMEA